MKLCFLTLVLLPLTASAQLFNFGIQGGLPAQLPLGQSSSMPFVLGPSVDIRALSWLSLETGVLYERIGSSSSVTFVGPQNAITPAFETSRGSALELPLLAKFRFRSEQSGWRPFVTAGPTVRRTSITIDGTSGIIGSVIGSGPAISSPLSRFAVKSAEWNVDPTVGMGMAFRTGRIHFEPEVRYSYWGAGQSIFVRKNQVNFLFGFRF